MSTENNNIIEEEEQKVVESVAERPQRHHTKPEKERGRFFLVRQILNIIFMIVAIAGVAVYFWNEVYGIIIVIIAMAFKMAECVIRYVK